jgi:hypothetical protein
MHRDEGGAAPPAGALVNAESVHVAARVISYDDRDAATHMEHAMHLL